MMVVFVALPFPLFGPGIVGLLVDEGNDYWAVLAVCQVWLLDLTTAWISVLKEVVVVRARCMAVCR